MIKSIYEHNATVVIEKDGEIIANINASTLSGIISSDKFNNVTVNSGVETIIKLEV